MPNTVFPFFLVAQVSSCSSEFEVQTNRRPYSGLLNLIMTLELCPSPVARFASIHSIQLGCPPDPHHHGGNRFLRLRYKKRRSTQMVLAPLSGSSSFDFEINFPLCLVFYLFQSGKAFARQTLDHMPGRQGTEQQKTLKHLNHLILSLDQTLEL